jgi:hypothetical protein
VGAFFQQGFSTFGTTLENSDSLFESMAIFKVPLAPCDFSYRLAVFICYFCYCYLFIYLLIYFNFFFTISCFLLDQEQVIAETERDSFHPRWRAAESDSEEVDDVD